MTEVTEWRGRTIVDSSGEKIGDVVEIYLDLRTGDWDWALVHARQFGDHPRFVPLAGAHAKGDEVRCWVRKDEVKDAPSIEPGGRLSEQEEEQLFAHYVRRTSRTGR